MSAPHLAMIQTGEVLQFLVSLARAHKEATTYGKLSVADVMKLIPLIPQAVAAIKGISEVPGELLDMDGTEADGLLSLVAVALNERLDDKRHRRIAERALVATQALADLAAEIAGNNPPQPEIVP